MRRAVTIDVEYRVTPWQRVSDRDEWKITHVSAYRIWIAHDGFRWWQSHEWEYKGGNGERWAEKWMPTTKGWPANACEPSEVDEPPPWAVRR